MFRSRLTGFAVVVTTAMVACVACTPGAQQSARSTDRRLKDGLGAEVSLAAEPKRVVTLVPSLAELAAEVLGDDFSKIVGVSEYTDYPPALKSTTTVGRYDRFSIERVMGLKPDLVLASSDGNSADQVARLRELGISVFVVNTSDFESIEGSMILVADALGLRARGENMSRQFRKGLEAIRTRALQRSSKKTVLMQVGADPLVVVGGTSFLNESLQAVGAKNVYGDRKEAYPRPSIEDAVHRNPDMVLVVSIGPGAIETAALSWKRFAGMKAVQTKQVKMIRADALVRPSLRLLEGLALLEKAVNGS